MTLQELKELLEEQEIANIISILDSMGYLVQKKKVEPTIPANLLVTARAGFVRPDGVPLTGVRVFVSPVEQNLSVTDDAGNTLQVGAALSPTVYTADASGTVSIPLVIGTRFRFHTSLSHVSREIVAPSADFDLFDSSLGEGVDNFTQPAPSYRAPVRRDI